MSRDRKTKSLLIKFIFFIMLFTSFVFSACGGGNSSSDPNQSSEDINNKIQTFTLSVETAGSGVVNNPETWAYDKDKNISLTATPEDGYYFHHWEGDLNGNTNPSVVVMDTNKSVKAVFAPNEKTGDYTLCLNINGQGTLEPAEGVNVYNKSAQVILTPKAKEGWLFHHWQGDITGSAMPVAITMDGNKSITAVFAENASNYTISAITNGNGFIALSPNSGSYTSGTQVAVTAYPSSNWVFHHWEGDISGGTNPTSITMNSNKTIKAIFVEKQRFSLTVTLDGQGSVSPSSGNYTENEAVTLVATPSPGWKFDYWNGDVSSCCVNQSTVIMNKSKTVTAVFSKVNFGLTVSVRGSGSVNLQNGSYDAGSQVAIHAYPTSGYRFDHWEGDVPAGSCSETIVITMDSNRSITAVFIEDSPSEYFLTIQSSIGGVVYPGSGNIKRGMQIRLDAAVYEGYTFDHWEIDGSYCCSTEPTTYITMNANHTVKAVFIGIPQYSLCVSTNNNAYGNVSPSSNTYLNGSLVSITANAYSGYRFDHWEGDYPSGCSTCISISITMNSNKNIKAVFVPEQANLTMQVSGNGTVSPLCGFYSFTKNSQVLLQATPSSGYKLDYWEVNGSNYTTSNYFYLTMDKAYTVKAIFVPVLASISGTITKNGGGALHGVTITLSGTSSGTTITNASGNYTFTGRSNGSYTITPTLVGYVFTPGNRAMTINGSNVTSISFVATVKQNDPIGALLNSMVSIPGGTFQMGSTDDEYGYAQKTTPVHSVTLQSFEIGAFEVTQAQYKAIMGTNPSYFQGSSYPGSENTPVEKLSWYEAMEFCTQLSILTGRTFTLPSEAQWEYACRAGTTTLYSFGYSDALLDNYAWYYSNAYNKGAVYGQPRPVGTKLPNAWGLYDMHGNVWEWCLDSWHANYMGAPIDGSAWEPQAGSNYVYRGGGWDGTTKSCRSADRGGIRPDYRFEDLGFRIVEVTAH